MTAIASRSNKLSNIIAFESGVEYGYCRETVTVTVEAGMERLWRERTGNKEDDFNCQELELTLKDLKTLEIDIRMRILPSTSGFFYGSDADDYYKGTDLAFIEDARSKIEAGKKVFYNSWW